MSGHTQLGMAEITVLMIAAVYPVVLTIMNFDTEDSILNPANVSENIYIRRPDVCQ